MQAVTHKKPMESVYTYESVVAEIGIILEFIAYSDC